MTGPTVVLAEDGTLLRAGLVELLDRTGFDVLASVGDADELLAAAGEHAPDLVVTDIRMPPGLADEGLRAAIELRRRRPGQPVVALSQYVERRYADVLLDSDDGRGVGYLLKDRVVDIDHFAGSLRSVTEGGTVIDPEVVRQLLRAPDPVARLTEREREVLGLVAQGWSNAAIRQRLHLSEPAVAKHIGNIFTKLDLPPDDETNRRVMAVLAHLRAGAP